MEYSQAALYSPAALAYLGDAVLELMVREHLMHSGHDKVSHLNELARSFVTAKSQSDAVDRMLPLLSEEEADIFRRGRNISHLTAPKNASAAEYRRATGLECLLGYLYMMKKNERIQELFTRCFLNKEETGDLFINQQNEKN